MQTTIPKFVAPSWLQDQDANTIAQRMMSRLPADISSIQGDFPWDLTMPSALEKAELLQFHAIEILKNMFPMWATGDFLLLHASGEGMRPKEANPAGGYVTVTGLPGTVIPAGFGLAVPAAGNMPAIEFRTIAPAELPAGGSVTVAVSAVNAGPGGNVPAGAISIMLKPLKGITAIRNDAATTGGTEAEDEESLRQRIAESDANLDISYVGCDADYKRWALEVDGVGDADVVANWDPAVPNSVKLVVLDANGQPANDQILAAVYNHILRPDDPIQRKSPTGAILTVTAPTARTINYTVTVLLKAERSVEAVVEDFKKALQEYYSTAKTDGVVRYNKVSSLLEAVNGVLDFSGLTLNGTTENVVLAADEYPVTGAVEAQTTDRLGVQP